MPTATLDTARTRALWLDRIGPIRSRPALDGDVEADVAIVGGGFSGLWTAYYLTEIDPSLRIVVVERDHVGFGASGRNGGWAVGELAGSFSAYAARSSPAAAMRLTRAIFEAVDEIGRVAEVEGVDCGFAKGGNIRLARTGPQAERQRVEVAEMHALGFTDAEIRMVSADEARRHVDATEVRSGIFFAPCAALDPARLVFGLADVVERRGVTIVEGTTARSIADGRIDTDRGTVRAPVVVRALEAYTAELAGHRRDLLPVYSYMIATEPLGDAVFDEIGLVDRPTFADDRTMVIYGQRTEDDRIAFGGTGMPYRYGSRIDPATEVARATHEEVHATLIDLLPVLRNAEITHRWGGVLGIPRNWLPAVCFDRPTGRATLGGYVGEGVAAANLAGRTLAELIVGHDTERSDLPWVGVSSRRWEPEPLRWVGVRASRAILARADAREAATDRESGVATRLAHALRGD